MQPDIYQDLKSNNPNPESIGVLIHEQTHVKRNQELGVLKFGVKYIFSPKFRFNEELIATKAQFRFYKQNKIKPDIKKRAKALSGWVYFWPVSYDYAFKELKRVWEEI